MLEIIPEFPRLWNALGYSLTMIRKFEEGIEANKNTLKYDNDKKMRYLSVDGLNKQMIEGIRWNK